MAVFPTLDFVQIKARYPKALAKIQKWVFEQPELQSVTDEFVDPKNPEKSKEMFVGLMIQMDPRKLYDIFDSFNIFISVSKGELDSFRSHVLGEDLHGGNIGSSRHEAEVSAFHDAFELLEKQS